MNRDLLIERFFETLISGHRPAARELVREARTAGLSPPTLITDLFWPTYELVERLYRNDQITRLSHHLATRLLRVLVDQNAALLAMPASRGRRVLALCGPADADELGAQMAVDLLEHHGFEVAFGGGGVPFDEILAFLHEHQPDVLLLFASGPGDLPDARRLIDTLREIGACPGLQIVVGGGVFNRAEGLAEEIGADLWATSPLALVDAMVSQPARRATSDQRTVGKRRRHAREAA